MCNNGIYCIKSSKILCVEGGRNWDFSWTSFEPECGSIITDQEHGSFKSPGYPAMYPNDRDCIWTIYADYGKRITFHFATVNIEHHPNCSYDFLKVNMIHAIFVVVICLQISIFFCKWIKCVNVGV